jgi:hypothetical protein
MAFPLADASFLELAVPAAAALGGVALGSVLPHLFTQRRNAEARYDAAITAVTGLQAARWAGSVSVPREAVKAADAEEHAKIEQELSVEGVRRFMIAAAEARAALAALYPYSPDLRKYWDRLEVPDSDLDELVRILSERRRKPTQRHENTEP